MPKVLEFRMVCDENDNFVRVYEALDSMVMLHLYEFVCDNLDYESLEPASFFTSNVEWDKLQQFVTEGVDDDDTTTTSIQMSEAKIKDAAAERGQRMILLFDIVNDRSFYLEISDVKEPQDGVEYPRLTFMGAEAPDQFDSYGYKESSIFDDAMNEFGEFDDDDSYDDDY